MANRSSGQNIQGILLLNKRVGPTSTDELSAVKKLFRANKAGHTGSLDPKASGMLPICFGEATKFSQFLLDADKQYYVEAKLGQRTTTGDVEGEIVATKSIEHLTLAMIENVIADFRGEIEQIPSIYSALKYRGKPLYSYARQGIEIPIEEKKRTITIKEFNLLHWEQDTLVATIRSSKGTYIRTLIEDIGEKLGCGAHVTSLSRSFVVPYAEHEMMTLDQIKDYLETAGNTVESLLLPIDSALQAWPVVHLTESMSYYIRQGQPVIVPKAPTSGFVRLMANSGTFLGVGEILDDGRVAPRRLIKAS